MIKTKKKILIVEDDQNFGTILRDFLEINGFEVLLTRNGIEGLNAFKKNQFDLCLLDVMMPYKDGFTLAKEIRNSSLSVPIIFLTAKSMKEDVLRGFKIGADDYLTKPFDSDVLLSKIKAIFKRIEQNYNIRKSVKYTFKIGRYFFNAKLRELSYEKNKIIKLSPKEGDLLHLLLLYKNDLMPRELALKKIWNNSTYFTSRSMDVYIAKLRKHLKLDNRINISNVHGEGFIMTVE